MTKYACEICGYEYDPETGDIDHDIAEGIEFDELPADWVCPECGAPKDDFSPALTFSDDVITDDE